MYYDSNDRGMTRETSIKTKPRPTKRDHAHTAGKVAAAAGGTVLGSMIGVPVLGVVFSEFYSTILKLPLLYYSLLC